MKRLLVFLALVVLSALPAIPALAGSQDFSLTNATGYSLVDLRVSPAGTDSWGDNVLTSPLSDGDTAVITFDGYDPSVDSWDIMATADTGDSVAWYGLDLGAIYSITLNADGTAELK
ncbi:MAG: hypothetical protein N3A57_00635 [Negativicutes bacterium]|nr:hypothetical protein [Negativicutes bacterium]